MAASVTKEENSKLKKMVDKEETKESKEKRLLDDLTLQYYNEMKLELAEAGASTSTSSSNTAAKDTKESAGKAFAANLPRFWDTGPKQEDGLAEKLRENARSEFLTKKESELMQNEDLELVWKLLEENTTPPDLDNTKMIGFENFLKVRDKVPPKAREYFRASIFGSLQHRDPYGRVAILTVFNYIMRKTWLRQSRAGLSLYDQTGQGYLFEKDLELYISELLPTMPCLARLEEGLHSFYICTAVRRILFSLDPKRLGRVRIVDILASGFLDDLLELRDAPDPNSVCTLSTIFSRRKSSMSTPRSDDSKMMAQLERLGKNWFSAENTLRVYGQYLNLDTDANGMISKDELKGYGDKTLTQPFIDRVFQECLTYEGEMDYKSYLDFVIAMENKKDRSALEYFFRILDVRNLGYLDAFAINFFFREIQRLLELEDQPMVEFEDLKDEIFDMVKPADPTQIRLTDLIACKQGDVVVNILTDLDGFWKYENREFLANEPEDDGASAETDSDSDGGGNNNNNGRKEANNNSGKTTVDDFDV